MRVSFVRIPFLFRPCAGNSSLDIKPSQDFIGNTQKSLVEAGTEHLTKNLVLQRTVGALEAIKAGTTSVMDHNRFSRSTGLVNT